MARVRVRIDGRTEFDGELGEWVAAPPDFVQNHIQQGAKLEPYMKAVMMSLTDAILLDKSLDIHVHTRAGGWLMDVETVG